MPTEHHPKRRTTPAAPPDVRWGPRPLPAHLAAATTLFATSNAVLGSLKNGSPLWNPLTQPTGDLKPAADALALAFAGADPEVFAAAAMRESRSRMDAFLTGVERYRTASYSRNVPDPPPVWSEGSTRLLDYGAGSKNRPVLLIPSLINRGYILDLSKTCSFARWLATQGLRPLLVDWGTPGPVERGFGLDQYIARLERGLDVAANAGPVSVLGYCMGGLLAMALAVRRQSDIDRLALLATPWDFHAPNPATALRLSQFAATCEPLLALQGVLPVDVIQMLFFSLDPFLGVRKFTAFGAAAPDSARAKAFVALEDWLNDGAPLTANVARECLGDWYGDNTPARGEWRVGGAVVSPTLFTKPVYVSVPANDRIVPPESALAIANDLPDATVVQPNLGHIGMMVGGGAKETVWAPLSAWLR
ncbi:MAG: alpha/beta hydrolase [Rhodospirillaceae bacterium]|nr:alpha/beta hydrolase [Rhodospirillaceae bacterium]